MRKKKASLAAFILVLLSLSTYLIIQIFVVPPPPSVTEVRLNFHDYLTRGPLEGLAVNFSMVTRTEDVFPVIGVSDENGRVWQALPTNDIAYPVSATNISISGRWVLEEAVGEEAKSIADQRWFARNPQAFGLNFSEYVFDKVYPSRERNGSALILKLDFYLAPGKLIGIYDPMPEARSLDRHLRISVLRCNYARFQGVNYAAVPTVEPLKADLEVNYFVYTNQPFYWLVQISVDLGNRTFIDLTSPFIRAVSARQIEELTRILDNLEPFGFYLTGQGDRLAQILNLYDLALERLENEDRDGFRIRFQSAMNSYRDLYAEVTGLYTNGVVCIPSLIMIFLFFSLSLSRMVTDRKDHSAILFIILFSVVFGLFFFTQPYLRLFIYNPLVLVQSFTSSLLIQLLAQLLPAILIIVVSLFGQIRSFIWETFEVSIRNLRRRRLKTLLALSTVLIVSASAMCFLTISSEKPVSQMPHKGLSPTVDSGLVISKTVTQVPFNPTPLEPTVYFNAPIQQYETEWLLDHDWVEAANFYGVRKVKLAGADGLVVKGFDSFNLIVVNASFMNRYQRVSDVLGIEWFEDVDRNVVIVGSRIAQAYGLAVSSEVLINNRKYVVKSIVDENTVIERLRDIDGDLFLLMVYDPVTGKIDGESFIFGTLKDFEASGILAYRISIILKSAYAQNAIQIARDIQGFGYDFGSTEDYSYVVTYLVHAIVSNAVYMVYSEFPTTTVSGQAPVVPVIIATLVLVTNMMGTVAERKTEVRTIHIIGASPLRVSLIFVTEGLVFGIVGGIFGYVFGYLLVQYANIALPTMIKENIVGGAPFTIAIFTATLASLLGCLLPSWEAMIMAVPSGRMRQRVKDIMEIQEGKAHLKMPLKVERTERDHFRRFLEDLAKEYSYPVPMFMSIDPPHIKEIDEATLYEVAVASYVTGHETASFLVSIVAKPNENLEVTLRPIENVETKKACKWTREHNENIKELSQILRREILRFTELKRKS